jgi:DNA modification methylase
MGSGTTAIAAIDCGVNFIGSEISESYCKMANDRINLRLSEPPLF